MNCRNCKHKIGEQKGYCICELTSTLINENEKSECMFADVDFSAEKICLNCKNFNKSTKVCNITRLQVNALASKCKNYD